MSLPSPENTVPSAAELDFDPGALRAKYRHERDVRLRPDGIDQFVETAGDFRHYVDDPHVEPGFTRAPLDDEIDVLIIGGGFGGLVAGARLREAGVERIRIIDKGGDFGGTWYWNRYPGAQCDIESYIYLPLLEETNYIPKEKYAFAPEIRAHAQRIGKTFDLYQHACFQTEILDMRWLEDERKWLITTNRDDRMKARHVVMSNGPLNRPKLPAISGIGGFKGHSFHTSRWDYGYTGGDTTGNLHKLADKRVAVIGTGATAIQCVSHLGKHAKQLYVFQRTPSSVDLRGNKPTDPEWVKSLTPGWQKRRRDNFNLLTNGGSADEDMVSDGWTDIVRNLRVRRTPGAVGGPSADELSDALEIADFRKMNQIRARVDSIIKDRATAEALKPWYRQFCKRPTFNDDYLPTFNLPNVKLIDTRGLGVERVTETGLVFDGVEYEVDCIIFATGFEVGTAYTRRAGFEVHGRSGQTLTEYWADGPRTLHGFYSSGFPNCFHMGLLHNAVVSNFGHMIDQQACHIADVIRQAQMRRAPRVEPTAEAEEAWVRAIRDTPLQNEKFFSECTPGYYNAEGKLGRGGFFSDLYGAGPLVFYDLVNDWRTKAGMPGLRFE